MYLWLAATLLFADSAAPGSVPMRPVLTQIQPDCRALGASWADSYGIKIDDLSSLQGLSSNEREVAQSLSEQLKPLGITSVADYSCVKSDTPLDIVTVRVFVFENPARAAAWWRKKYEYENWEQHYTKIPEARYPTVDSVQQPKRAMLVSNLWITSHHIRPGNEHTALLDNVLSQLGKHEISDVAPGA